MMGWISILFLNCFAANVHIGTYFGSAVFESIQKIIYVTPLKPLNEQYVGLTVAKDFFDVSDLFSLGLEGSIFFQVQKKNPHFNAVWTLKWKKTPFSNITPSYFQIGNGISYALSPPSEIEAYPYGYSHSVSLLYSIFMEFAFQLNSKSPGLEAVIRLQHRSGVFGLITSERVGSNYLGLGLRVSL